MLKLRDYQEKVKSDTLNKWDELLPNMPAGQSANVVAVMPTGGGKSATLASIVATLDVPTAVIAHRQELITQLSLALARNDIHHNVIAPNPVIKLVNQLHIWEFGKSFYRQNSAFSIAGVDTLMSRKNDLAYWAKSINLWVQDEAHHVLKRNKWGAAAEMFVNAKRGLGVTATPCRADNRGLGRLSDGVFDAMVEGPNLRWLINEGYLTDYTIFAPPSDMDFSDAKIGESGDYNHKQLRVIAKKSHIVGDVVKHYLKLSRGKLGITFAPDIETANEIAENFRANGVPAAVIHGKTPDEERISVMQQFRNRQLLQIVNVDILGEGVDVPAVEVVSFARRTESFALFVQQCGRSLRPTYASGYDLNTRWGRLCAITNGGKQRAIIIDHVGNVERHAIARDCEFEQGKLIIDLCYREWSLDGKRGKSKNEENEIPLRTCLNEDCFADYPRVYKKCPYCGYEVKVDARSSSNIEFIDGDLTELHPEEMRNKIEQIRITNMSPSEYRQHLVYDKNVPSFGTKFAVEKHERRLAAQSVLRANIAQWAGWQREYKRPDSESYRRFYFMFGTDVMTAQTLDAPEALALADKIQLKMTEK